MNKLILPLVATLFVISLIGTGCSTWEYPKLSDLPVSARVPAGNSCAECHADQYDSWKKTAHADSTRMAVVAISQFRECGACHDNLAAHAEDPTNVPTLSIPKLSRSDQNKVCGKCHFSPEVLTQKAINPKNRHGLFMSYGFQGYKDTLSCLDCHSGHDGRKKMLQSIQAHTCFKCHKEAIVTMGVFQPFNYIAGGWVCLGCHPAHGGTAPHQLARVATGAVITCLVCHPTGDPSRLGFSSNGVQGGD
jgi:predicted CXXCH cytochrome family protein